MIKVQAETLIKKVNLGNLNTFQSLSAGVKSVFQDLPSELSFYYIDQDDDQIEVNNTSDLEIYLKSVKRSKLFVKPHINLKIQSKINNSLREVQERSLNQTQKQFKILKKDSPTSTSPKKQNEFRILNKQPFIFQKKSIEKQISQICLSNNLGKPINLSISVENPQNQIEVKNSNQKQNLLNIQNSQDIIYFNYIRSIYQLFDPDFSQKQNLELIKLQINQNDIEENSFLAVMAIWESSKTLSRKISDQFQDWQNLWSKKI